jgi:hypothetical protein
LIALNLIKLNTKFKGNSDNTNLLDKEKIINNIKIKRIKEKVNKRESITFITPLLNNIFILY